LARDVAREAGALACRYFGADIAVERKADQSPVTVADREAELLLRRRIEAAFPDDGIAGEEFPDKQGDSPLRWIVDPIDGTKAFVCGVPLFGTLVAVLYDERPVIGVIEMPALAETVYAACGHGAWRQRGDDEPQSARVSDCASLADGLVATSQIDLFSECGVASALAALQDAAGIFRYWGDCYGYVLVATGRAVAMVDPIVNPWDIAPMPPILSEAGGTFSDWAGRETIFGGEGVATNGHVQNEVLAMLAAAQR